MAESPVITCPECRKKFKGKGNLEGKKIKCPACAKIFVVAGEKTAEQVPPAAGGDDAALSAMAPLSASKPLGFADEEDNDPNPYGVTELDIAPRCPNCAQL